MFSLALGLATTRELTSVVEGDEELDRRSAALNDRRPAKALVDGKGESDAKVLRCSRI